MAEPSFTQLRRIRSGIRTQVTKVVASLEQLLILNPVDEIQIQGSLKTLEQYSKKLQALDEKILHHITNTSGDGDDEEDGEEDNEKMNKELEDATGYQEKVNRVLSLAQTKLSPPPSVTSSLSVVEPSSSAASVNGVCEEKQNKEYRLDKLKIKEFTGEVSDWLRWWSQFSRIHVNPEIGNATKLVHLSNSMKEGTRAQQLVDSYPVHPDNYPLVIEGLKERFGAEDMLIPHYIRNLLRLMVQNATATEKLPISTLYDRVETDVRALGTLKVTTQEMSRFLHPIVETCLAEDTFKNWQMSPFYGKDGSTEEPPRSTLDFLLLFLKEEGQRQFRRQQARADFDFKPVKKDSYPNKGSSNQNKNKPNKKEKKNGEEPPTIAGFVGQNAASKSQKCVFCGRENHKSQSCFRAKVMTYEEKKKKVFGSRVCFICLVSGHVAKECKEDVKCKGCGGKHYDVMCTASTSNSSNNSNDKKKDVTHSELGCLGIHCDSGVLLKTCLIWVMNPKTLEKELVRVLFDDGSQSSYVITRAVSLIKSEPFAKEESRLILLNGSVTKYEQVNKHELLLSAMNQTNNKENEKVVLKEKAQLGGVLPKLPSGPWVNLLRKENVWLSDWEKVNTDRNEIDILIGSDYYEKFRTGKRVKIDADLFAVETVFGWTLSGKLNQSSASDTIHSYFGAELSKLWDLEAINIRDPVQTETRAERDERVKVKFQSEISKDTEGRYQVRLPFIEGITRVVDNYGVAMKRLQSSCKRMNDEDFKTYDTVFKDWESNGIIEIVPPHEVDSNGHFLPHRAVFKPDSLTTPVRPVFDASARMGNNPSINMLLETGPNMLEMIPAILLRFRRHRVGATADIRRAFLTISVAPEHRKFQKFLWYEDSEKKKVKVYWSNRVMFGMTSSPFALAAVIDHHLNQVHDEDREIAERLRISFYVDNYVTSHETPEQYKQFREKAVNVMASAVMDLTQWESNCDDIDGDEFEVKVLGLLWNKRDDTLSCKLRELEISDEQKITNRFALSLVSQIFDPIGFTSPATLPPKLLLQKSHAMGKKWDEEWEKEDRDDFLAWAKVIKILGDISIPRHAFLSDDEDIQLHLFTDGSQSAYGCVVFVRCNSNGTVKVQLLAGKSRVAPLAKKKVTIPRLELLGCTIGSRMLKAVTEAIQIQKLTIHCWTDSTTCLAWIRRKDESEMLGIFVGRRVNEINNTLPDQEWRHVPGCMNPADLPSRGCTPYELMESRWTMGPSWLYLPEESWPSSQPEPDEEEVQSEKKKTVVASHAVEKATPKFNSFMKNVRVMGWAMRYIHNLRRRVKKEKRVTTSRLNFHEMRIGESELFYQIQKSSFGDAPPKVKGKEVFKLGDGLWHLKTGLLYRDDTELFKFPIILPKDDPIVNQLVHFIHVNSCHTGTQHVLGRLRQRYWIIHPKRVVKSIIHKCVRCQRYRASGLTVEPAPLPKNRVQATHAFETTGVDLAGPLTLKGGSKVWIVLYTCAVFRGVHLDTVDSLSTEAFLMSLERFINTVGRVKNLYSDQGTNFVGTRNLWKKIDWVKVKKESGMKQIQWVLNPPSSPWWGGWWERLVRSTKEIVRKMLGRARVTLDQLRTCLSGVQLVINDRPLTTISADAEDLLPLTPSLFMRDIPVAGFPEGEEIIASKVRGSYHKIQNLKSGLQARFRKEYLGFLTSRNCGQPSLTPKIGAVVLVGDDNRKRWEWPLGKITKLISGPDGNVRVAELKTATGSLTRPLQRLHPLELPDPQHIPSMKEELVIPRGKEKQDTNQVELDEQEKATTTRSGRISRRPHRYMQWNM